MGRISDEDVQRVRDATDLVSLVSETVVLKQKGRLFWGNCPFHGEKTPSFKIDPGTQLWHCFGCGLGGDAFGFLMRRDSLEFPDAVRLLADRANIEIVESGGNSMPSGRRERLIAASEAAAEFYHKVLTTARTPDADKARRYLKERGFGSDVAKRFRLGYAPGRGALVRHLREAGFKPDEIEAANLGMGGERGLRDRFYERVMFPIADLSGRTIAFGGRVLGSGEPKYLNTAETPVFSKSANMYAVDVAKNEIVRTGTAVVVEGYTDVIAMHEAGMGNVVATLGTALTARHLKLLARFAQRVVYLFDGDEAGLRAADRAAEFIDWQARPESAHAKLDLAVAVIPGGADPADFVASDGVDALRDLVAGAMPLIRFVLDRRIAAHDATTPEGRSRALASAAAVIASLKESVLAHDYSSYIADRLTALAPHAAPLSFETVYAVVQRTEPQSRHIEEADADSLPASSASVIPVVFDAQAAAERELLGLLALAPRLRPQARELLDSGDVSVPLHASLMAAILAEESTGRELFDTLVATEPEAAGMVSEWLVAEEVPEDASVRFLLLARRVKELGIERRIARLKNEMEAIDPVADRSTYDNIFKTIVDLQRERQQLRRAVRPEQDMEA